MADPLIPVPAGGVQPKGWQYPIMDPLAALINALEARGRYVDPFNRSLMRGMGQVAGGLPAQFFSRLMQGGGVGPENTAESQFGDWLGQLTQGKSIIQPFGLGEAQDFFGKYSDLLSQVKGSLRGPSGQVDWSDPAAVQAALEGAAKSGAISPLQQALAGFGLQSPERLQWLYSGGMGSSLGPTLGGGLDVILGKQKDLWERILEGAAGLEGRGMTFLDLLLGRRGGVTPGAGVGATTGGGAGQPPGSTYTPGVSSGVASSPGLAEALQPAPAWSSEFDTPRGRGHVANVGVMEPRYRQMLGSRPQGTTPPSLLERLLELIGGFPGMLQFGQATPGQEYPVGPLTGRGF